MSLGFEAAGFAASEAAAITGLSADRQRDLRRHGYLPTKSGHARFDLYELAEMLFIQRMMDRGVGPKVSAPLASIAATGIGWFALQAPEAFEGDHLRLIEAGIVPPVVWGSEDEKLMDAAAARASDYGQTAEWVRERCNRQAREANAQARFLARYIAGMVRGRVIPGRYLILWADGTETFQEDVQSALDGVWMDDPRLSGPIVVIFLEALGGDLLRRAGRPFYGVRIGEPNHTAGP
jgi:hypothetical protein